MGDQLVNSENYYIYEQPLEVLKAIQRNVNTIVHKY